jgi:hypothetical protein
MLQIDVYECFGIWSAPHFTVVRSGTFRTLRAGAGEELIRTGGLDGTEGSVNHYWQPGRVLEFLSELGCVWLLDNGVHTANQALCIVPPLEFHGRPV